MELMALAFITGAVCFVLGLIGGGIVSGTKIIELRDELAEERTLSRHFEERAIVAEENGGKIIFLDDEDLA